MQIFLLLIIFVLIVVIHQAKEIREFERKALDAFRIVCRKKSNRVRSTDKMLLDDKDYLIPPDNESNAVFKCFFCEEDIYEGEEYYLLNGFYCCKDCLDTHFKFIAELPDYEAEQADLEHHDVKE